MHTELAKWKKKKKNRCENDGRYFATALNRNESDSLLHKQICKSGKCENASLNVSCTGRNKMRPSSESPIHCDGQNKTNTQPRKPLWIEHALLPVKAKAWFGAMHLCYDTLGVTCYVAMGRNFAERLMQLWLTSVTRKQVTNDCQQFLERCMLHHNKLTSSPATPTLFTTINGI